MTAGGRVDGLGGGASWAATNWAAGWGMPSVGLGSQGSGMTAGRADALGGGASWAATNWAAG